MNPRRQNVMCRRFGTLFHLRRCTTHEDGTECSETTAHTIQTPGIHLKDRIQLSDLAYSITDFHFSWYRFRKRVPIFDATKPACISDI